MSTLDLDAVRKRNERARQLLSRSGDHPVAVLARAADSVADVPALLAEVERLNAVIGEAVRAYYELKDREDGYSGHGREGHLNERDLYLLRDALGLTPPWVCSGCGAPGSPLRPCELCGTTVVRSAGSTDG